MARAASRDREPKAIDRGDSQHCEVTVYHESSMGSRAKSGLLAALLLLLARAPQEAYGQVLEFESGGLSYKAQTRGGVTVMFAPLPTRILGYAIIQVAISNGSPETWTVQPEDFRFNRASGTGVQALAARAVVNDVFDRAGRGDVGRLIAVYEAALFGNAQVHSTNGYESRRRDAMAVGSTRMRAAAAASAIVLGTSELAPGESTDGAVFFPNSGQPLGAGVMVVTTAGETFVFPVEPPPVPR